MSRTSSLTPDIIDKLEQALHVYPSKTLACQAVGVKYSTFKYWMAEGGKQDADPLYSEFAMRIGRAEAEMARESYQEAREAEDGSMANSRLHWLKLRFPSVGNEAEAMSLIDAVESRPDVRRTLLDKPPPKMIRAFEEHGYWRFPLDIDPADRALLVQLKAKYNSRGMPACLAAGESSS